jgi:hypothetical protein
MSAAIRGLLGPVLDTAQLEASFEIMGVDSGLIDDGTYFAVTHPDGRLIGCGGWSASWSCSICCASTTFVRRIRCLLSACNSSHEGRRMQSEKSIDAVANGVTVTVPVGDDHGQSCGHGFDGRQAKGLLNVVRK